MSVTFGYYERDDNPAYINDKDEPAYIYTLLYELSPIEITSISLKGSVNKVVSVVGDTPSITPLGMNAREVVVHGKFANEKSKGLIMKDQNIPERLDDKYLTEGKCLRVHRDTGFSAMELVNFNASKCDITTSQGRLYLKSYPFYTSNAYAKAAYWMISEYREDQHIKQKLGRLEFDLTLSYNWIWDKESLWRF